MAVHRPAPTIPLDLNQNFLEFKKTTYALPKKNKTSAVLKLGPTSVDQLSFIKKDILKTILVALVILIIILFAVSRLK